MSFSSTLHSLWQILVVGIVLGAGLPAMFAVGVRFLTSTAPDTDRRTIGGTLAATACFAVIAIAILVGVAYIMKNFLAHDFGIHIF